MVISGPSGVGKSSIIRRLLKACENFTELLSATTRDPRPGEQNGVDYIFISKEEFRKGLENGDIPEYRHTPETDNYYGTYLPDLRAKLDAGKIVIADVDIIGARFLKENFDALTVFVLPPSEQALILRIKKRKDNMSEKELRERLQIAKREINEDKNFYDYQVVNEENKLNETMQKIFEILKKEKISCQKGDRHAN